MSIVERTVTLGAPLEIADVDAIARGARVELAAAARLRLQRSYEFLQAMVQRQVPVYGLTTGCGPLAASGIDSEQRSRFQINLVRSHACTLGTPHTAELVRAAMAIRAQVLAQGSSGVEPACVDILIAMLNHRVHPIVCRIGGVGASGDLVELAQIALAVLGEGEVDVDGHRVAASTALHDAGVAPLVPRFREGLALMNGTSFHAGSAAVLWSRAQHLLRAAEAAAAVAFDALRGHVEALDAALHAARGFTGQTQLAARLRQRLAGSALVRRREPVAGAQDAYTLRCTPQVLGAVADVLASTAGPITTEINAINDNPLFLADEDRVVHGGNFHGQPVALALDQIKMAVVEVGVIAERRLARLLDAQLNGGLPPFLVRDTAGLHSGFMGLQYGATTMAAENLVLAAPASVHSLPTNANNQDVVSMAMLAARQLEQILGNVERIVAIELLCGAQALELRGLDDAAPATRRIHAQVRRQAAGLDEDRPLSREVEALRAQIADGAFDDDGEVA